MSAIFFAANILAAKSNAEKLSNDASLQFGFCRPNLMWVNDKKKCEEILDGIKASGAKCVQLTLRENSAPTLQHIEYANSIGLPVNMLIMPMQDFMLDGAKPRPKSKNFWSVYGVSQVDLKKFEKKLDEYCAQFGDRAAEFKEKLSEDDKAYFEDQAVLDKTLEMLCDSAVEK